MLFRSATKGCITETSPTNRSMFMIGRQTEKEVARACSTRVGWSSLQWEQGAWSPPGTEWYVRRVRSAQQSDVSSISGTGLSPKRVGRVLLPADDLHRRNRDWLLRSGFRVVTDPEAAAVALAPAEGS